MLTCKHENNDVVVKICLKNDDVSIPEVLDVLEATLRGLGYFFDGNLEINKDE